MGATAIFRTNQKTPPLLTVRIKIFLKKNDGEKYENFHRRFYLCSIRKTNLLFYSSHWESLFIYHSGTDFIQYT